MAIDLERHLDDLLAKDEQAFETVYHATKYGVYAVIRAIVRDASLTEDLMQETYLRMMQKLNGYRRGGNFNAWLTQIAKNIAYDHLRKDNREDHVDVVRLHEIVHPSEPDSSIWIDFDRLLETFSTEERTILMMKIVGGSSFKEIARAVGKSVGTVHASYKKAIAKLTKMI